MRDRGQWRLSDLQRLFLALAVVLAAFLSAMSLGWGNIGLLLVALLLLVVAGVAVFLLGLWYSGQRHVKGGTAYVTWSSPPPTGQIVGRCDMRLVIDLPDGSTKMIKLRDPSVPVVKWPRPGSVLPFDVDDRKPRILRILWDKVNPDQPRSDDAFAYSAPFHTEYVDDLASPFDAPPTATQTPILLNDDPPPYRPAFLDPAMDLVEAVDADIVDGEVVDDAPGPRPPAAIEANHGESLAEAAEHELPVRVPQPRPAEPAGDPAGAEPNGARPGMGIMLLVADLDRSLSFYRDTLGFEVLDTGNDEAVLAYGGGRVLLYRTAGRSPVDRRIYLHMEVADVEAAYQELRAKGVEFTHKPRVLSRGDKLELWAANFRDPDEHGIALTQWRDRQDVRPPG